MSRRLASIVLPLVLILVIGLLTGAAGATAGGHARAHPGRLAALGLAHREPTVASLVRHQLARSHSGKVTAIVTTWSRKGLAELRRLGVRGVKLDALPMLVTRGLTRAQLRRLEHSSSVRSVDANRKFKLDMEDSTWITAARYAWSTSTPSPGPAGLGVTGAGVDVAVIDTGADGKHADMDNLVEFCEAQQSPGDHTGVLCSPFNPASGNAGPAGVFNDARLDSTDDPAGEGHGSHTSGTVAGSGDASGGRTATHSTIGMAPDAKLHVYSANVGPSLLSTQILSAYDDLIYKRTHNIGPRVVAVSNSWGGGGGSNYDPNGAIQVAIKTAYNAGILSVFAAGNDGAEHNTLSAECVSPYVICVAASTKPDSVVMFSSRGRPSEPADTNRNGTVGDAGDVPPDNQDRALAQALNLGLYRPTLTAPGANIYSINNEVDDSPGACPEANASLRQDCYVAFNGTSMATPHTTGAVALIVQAYRSGHSGATPTPSVITDILERSSNVSKLPGYESEEQGAGRLDAYQAVKYAKTYPTGLPKPNFGTPSPPYEAGKYPGAPGTTYVEKGCTGTGSWSVQNTETLLDPVGQPPGPGVVAPRYGQHVIDVPQKTERLRVTVDWPRHTGANLYARLWRPGVNPDAEFDPAGPSRVFADQEATGLVFVGTERWLDIRAPEAGKWILRVYHRAGGASSLCDTDSRENPKQAEGFNYTVKVELPTVTLVPTVSITSPSSGSTPSTRFVPISGTAGYPTPWNGVTNWEVPGSGNPASGTPGPDTRPVLHFHGNALPHASGEPNEASCVGDGATDEVACGGPFLIPNPAGANLSSAPAASWKVPDPLLDEDFDQSVVDPNWIWKLGASTTVSGPMTIEWWASCGACDAGLGISADWTISLWADGSKQFEQRITATPSTPNVAEKLVATVNLPTITASNRLVLKIDPVYIDSQANTKIYYDSTLACPTASGADPCDSIVRMPVGTGGSGGGPAPPQNVRVSDRHSGLVVAWDAVNGATSYLIYRSTNPAFVPATTTPLVTTAGTSCNSPDVPSWPTASRPGLCYTDSGVTNLTTYYYRVVAVQGTARGAASLLAYGTPTLYDRQVKLKVDRLFGPQYWDFASLVTAAGTSWNYSWDTLELAAVSHLISARSFTQGIGSAKATITVKPGGGGGGGTPATLTLAPKSATNEVGQQHCVTATVKDSSGSPVGGATVRFSVTGPGNTSGTKTTAGNGQATFCYTSSQPGVDSIKAYADSNLNNSQDTGEPSDTASKTWTLPASTPCEAKITNGGWITAANGDKATFGGNAKADSSGNTSGQEQYQDHGPAQAMTVKATAVLAITCNADRTQASIFGTATIDGSGSYDFRIDVRDLGEPGSSDRYRMRVNSYDSGEQVLKGGNVQIH